MQATHVIVNFLGTTLKSEKERGHNDLNSTLCSTQHTQKYSQCNMCSAFYGWDILHHFLHCLWSFLCILYLEHISVWPSHISSAIWPNGYCTGQDVNVCVLSHVQLFVTPWTVDCQIPLSMGFPWQESWSGLPFPSPGIESKMMD